MLGLESKKTHFYSPFDQPYCSQTLGNLSNALWVFYKVAAHLQACPIIQDGDNAKIPHPGGMTSYQNPYHGYIRRNQMPYGCQNSLLQLDIDRCISIVPSKTSYRIDRK